MKYFIIFIFILLTGFSTHSCSCGNPGKLREYPHYNGSAYPDEIDLDEATETGTVFYADPSAGIITNQGTASSPWSTFREVIENNKIETMEPAAHPYENDDDLVIKNPGAPVKAGDTIILKSGHHGEIFIRDYFNSNYINVIAEEGAVISRLHIQSGCRWRFKGLTITPDSGYTEGYTLVFFESHNWHGPVYNITIDDCNIHSVPDSTSWNMDDWNNLSCNGIQAFGRNMTIRGNYLKNVNFGLTVSGNFALAKDNTIENFAGDGMRGLGNDLFFEYNTIKNCYAVNANHDDGFQSWSINDDPPRERVILRGNVIINYTDPLQLFRGALQGIGCFDGFYINWVIENNIVITDHWHGISMYGAINCRIVNNTVIDENDDRPGPPWIAIVPHKDGTPSMNCLIRNNIATSITATDGVTEDHNYVIENFADYPALFANPPTESLLDFNLHLVPGTPVIDAGTEDEAPYTDIEGNARPNGPGLDLGAYEYYP